MTPTTALLITFGLIVGASLGYAFSASKEFDHRYNTDANGLPKKPPAD